MIVVNNLEMVKLLMNYAKENHIYLEINNKNKEGLYPYSYAMRYNNFEMMKLLMNYAKENNNYLKINEKDMEEGNAVNNFNSLKRYKKMINWIMEYAKNNNINIVLDLREE